MKGFVLYADQKKLDKIYNRLLNTNYGFNDRYGITFVTPMQYNKICEYLHILRKYKYFDIEDYRVIESIFRMYERNYNKIRTLEENEDRVIAQKFISKKNIRQFIFKRDCFTCLKCYSFNNLSIDHIIPISKGGKNKIGNLQTLCTRCNSIKRDTYKDYR